MTIRPQYHTLRDRLRRLSATEHFISNASDKEAIGRAAEVIEKLTARVAQLDDYIDHLRSGGDTDAA